MPAQSSRLARAQAALRLAELQTGVRTDAFQPPRLTLVPALPAEGSEAVSGGPTGDVVPTASSSNSGPHNSAGLPIARGLQHLIPGGTLALGQVYCVLGSVSLLLALLAQASADGAWVAFVGAAQLGVLAAAEAGLALDRLALIPDPGLAAAKVVAALLDGMSVVVIGPQAALSPADRRRLASRARERGAVLISTTDWAGATVSLQATGSAWQGTGQGAGWLQGHRLDVRRTGRGEAARPRCFAVELPVGKPAATVLPAAIPATPLVQAQKTSRAA